MESSFIYIFLAVFGLIVLSTVATIVFMFRIQKMQAKAVKREDKRVDTELEIAKTKASFEIEKERAAITPIYCRYCGARHEPNAKSCSACGSSLK